MDFLDKELEIPSAQDGSWRGRAVFTGEEPFFHDHFPGYPLVPGVLLLECMRGVGARARESQGKRVRLVETSRVRFIRPVTPPSELTVVVNFDSDQPLRAKAELHDTDGQKVATATLCYQTIGDSE